MPTTQGALLNLITPQGALHNLGATLILILPQEVQPKFVTPQEALPNLTTPQGFLSNLIDT